MRGGPIDSRSQTERSLRKTWGLPQHALLAAVVALAPLLLNGCAGVVSGTSTTGNPPPSTLNITNVQAASATTSTTQIVWTTNVAADSAVDYGTSTSLGSSTPIDPAMVTSHQVTLSGLAAGTTYYYQVTSSDSNGNHGHSGGHGFKTAGFSLSGAINPAAGGNGATLTLTGAASATTTADSSGNYTFTGLPNGTYAVAPGHAGFTFTPNSQSMAINGANVTGVNFTDTAQTFSISGTISPTAGGSGATVALTGATSATTTANSLGVYTFTGLVGGSYTITPSNTGYTFTPASQSVTLSTVNVTGVNFTGNTAAVAPTITAQPVSQTVTAGQTASFTVVATGTAPLSYQWQKSGVNIAGATAASYTTPATTTSDNGATFAVVVSNTAGTVTSAAAALTVNTAAVAPTITMQPVSQAVTAGQTASFTVVAAGTAPLSYQWQKSGVNIAGATAASYTTPATTTSDNGASFAVVVSNTAGTVTSAAATLTVNAAAVAPTITTQPVSQTVTAGQTASFTVVATGTAPLSYQWQKSGVNIAGATAASYTTPATTTSDNGATFRVVVSNTAGTVTSGAAALTVNAAAVAPTITMQPASQAVTAGQTASFTVVATGTAPLNYQWQKSGVNIAGATAASYTTPATTTSDNGASFDVVVSNTAGTVTSAAATLTVNPAVLTVGINPTSLSFGNVTTGTSSAAQSVIITDTGNSNVAISQITLTGAGYTMTGGSAPVTLTPSQNITLSVQFSPNVTGTVNGNISIVSNATGSPATVSLTGTGVVQHSVALTWNASASAVAGYNVYRGTVSGGPYAKINATLVTPLSYTDSTVQSGTTYYYVTTAVDSSGTESVFSNQVSAVIP